MEPIVFYPQEGERDEYYKMWHRDVKPLAEEYLQRNYHSALIFSETAAR